MPRPTLEELDEQLADLEDRLDDLDADFFEFRAEYLGQRFDIIATMTELQQIRRECE